ncbi:CDP-alcohol phosphatidyltransferase family protein [Palleronia sp. LCG004]|uniref:CDP-alcohol phosphatidyltransferase family protein n=1 Tax=Palleronia sp. LCG004 TaxID=3079304 RepID=UPI0029438A88|nr:CDP-alcohol phosphatidyltransferase family protein [Palleronia sp. LCG004]WOI57292.1 CDP-alcohol phosphatidyltransferase family protein [Palleronia sp. LCG004]
MTTLRLALMAGLAAGLLGDRGADWSIFAVAMLVLLLDGVDGWLARREGVASEFGARFDMEVDAALAAILSLVLLVDGRGGVDLLVLGGARYAFVAASFVLPWLSHPLAPSLRRKTICVLQIGALAVLSAPILPDWSARPLAVVAAAFVFWSFARDIRRLAATR